MKNLISLITIFVFYSLALKAQSNPNSWEQTSVTDPLEYVYAGPGTYYTQPLFIRPGQNIVFEFGPVIYNIIQIRVDEIHGSSWQTEWTGTASGPHVYDPAWSNLGVYTLRLRWKEPTSSVYNSYSWTVYVIPSAQKVFKDNSGNRMIMWDNNNTVDDPMIVLEGFDPTNENNANLYFAGGLNFFQPAIAAGKDVIVFQFANGGGDLRTNADYATEGIKYIQGIKSGNSQIILAGVSMGAVIARYMLSKAEHNSQALDVSHFVSLDGPQKGAVMDPVLLAYINQNESDNPSLNSVAAKQLLTYNPFDPFGNYHSSFYQELNSFNGDGFPNNPINVGVAFSKNNDTQPTGVWLNIDVAPHEVPPFAVDGQMYIISGQEIQKSGSLLPLSSTNIWVRAPILSYVTVSFTRTSKHPTFISTESALYLDDQGNSKFDITIESDKNYFHDEVPDIIVTPLLLALEIESPYHFFSNRTISTSFNYLNDEIYIADNATVSIESTVTMNNTTVNLGKDARIEVRNGGKLITDGATFKRLNASDQHDGIRLYTNGNQIKNTTIEGAGTGIYMSNSYNNLIKNSIIKNNNIGIGTNNADGLVITGSTIEDNNSYGLHSYYSTISIDPNVSSGTQPRTTFQNNGSYAIFCSISSSINVRNTTFTNNGLHEIYVNSSSRLYMGYYSSGNSDHGNNVFTDAPSVPQDPVPARYIYSLALSGSGETATQWNIPARKNYWHDGDAPPWHNFFGSVDYSNHLTSNPEFSSKIIAFKSVESATTGQSKINQGYSSTQVDNSIRFKELIWELREEIESSGYAEHIGKLIRSYSGMVDASDKELLTEEIRYLSNLEKRWLARYQYINDISLTDSVYNEFTVEDGDSLDRSTNGQELVKRINSVQNAGEVMLALQMQRAIDQDKYHRVFNLAKEYDGFVRSKDLKYELINYMIVASIQTERYNLALRLIGRLEAMEPDEYLLEEWQPEDFTILKNEIESLKTKSVSAEEDDQLAAIFESDIDLGLDELIRDMVSEYKLYPAYPNPFNPSTIVSFDLPQQGKVRVDVFDISGRLVSVLANQTYQSGNHRLTFEASGLASGIYLVRANIAGNVQTQRITLIK